MRITLLVLVCFSYCVGCVQKPVAFTPEVITDAMASQQKAWNAGDIHGFMQIYSDTVCFTSTKGTTCGKRAVTDNYIRSYPNKAAMGQLIFGLNEVLPSGNEHARVTGTWRLDRAADTLGGGFSLLWVREGDGWRIARDHTY